MLKKLILIAVFLAVVIGGLALLKLPQFKAMEAAGAGMQMPPQAVSTATAVAESWNPTINAVGSLVAENGITLSAETSGVLARIEVVSGAKVAKGDLIAQMDVSMEEAQLRSAEASVELARLNAERIRELRSRDTLAQSEADASEAQLKQAVAAADQIRAVIEKKTFRAPFAGRLGIRRANLGQFLNGGDTLVSLEALDPIHVDFNLPQQRLSELESGQNVRVIADAAPGRVFEGRISAIDSSIDPQTRTIRIRATLANGDELLRPGMFAKVEVVLPAGAPQVVVPVTAVNYSTSGNTVFVVETAKGKGPQGSDLKTVRQEVVRLGQARGDFITILAGVKPGEEIVTLGGFKLRNGGAVIVNNALAPKPELAPTPANS
jgi:membrane fusion protein (multidrug efflux system)